MISFSNECVIDANNYLDEIGDIVGSYTGLVARDLTVQPVGSSPGAVPFDPAVDLIPRSEWTDRIKDNIGRKSQLSDLRNFDALDQNGQGYCWAYGATVSLMLLQAAQGLKPERLSPHAVACRIKGFRDEGAWGALAVEKLIEWGCPSEDFWPQQSMARKYDTPATWENAKRHRITEGFVDIDAGHPADAHLEGRFDAVMSLLISGVPVPADFYFMGHHVCLMDAVVFEEVSDLSDPNRWGVRFLNSYGKNWKGNGTAILRGRQAVPDGATAPRAVVVY